MSPYTDLSKFNFWNGKSPSSEITIDFLLPNGLNIPISSPASISIGDLRSLLWSKASQYPLFDLLKEKEKYSFTAVRRGGLQEELVDNEQSLFEAQPFRPYLKVAEKQGNEAEKVLNSKISVLIGRSIADFDNSKNQEVADFRRKYRVFCATIAAQRGRASWERRAVYSFPPKFADDEVLPDILKQKVPDSVISITVTIAKDCHQTFNVNISDFPSVLLTNALRKKGSTFKLAEQEKVDDYVLKEVGYTSYLLGTTSQVHGEEVYHEYPLHFYKCIRDSISTSTKAHLSLVPKCELQIEERTRGLSRHDEAPPLPPRPDRNVISLWDISPTTEFKIKIVCALKVFAGTMKKVVRCGVYHGGESLCDIKTTSPVNGDDPRWNKYLDFNLAVCDIPRMARLCLCIYGYPKARKGRSDPKAVPLYWVNTTIFDYKGNLRTGLCHLYCWPCGPRTCIGEQLHPLGSVVSNSNTDGCCILVEFHKFAEPVMYPQDDKIFELAAAATEQYPGANPLLTTGNRQHIDQLKLVLSRDPLTPLFEQDKELLWFLRAECFEKYPHSLPKLLQSVKWNCREEVAQMYCLLQSWRKDSFKPEEALELLDYTFPDSKVRKFAVDLIERFNDNELEQYLLQLVQVLKFESYLDCPLAKFLLKRALNNRRIGHFLFWHLRAEMSSSEVILRFGLLLEAYCRGSIGHIPILKKQQDAINKLKTIIEVLQGSTLEKKEIIKWMRRCLQDPSYAPSFSDLYSPLDPSVKLKCPKPAECKFMDSKKKPLWLQFENDDPLGKDVFLIFKVGDDLRQDMLTLQMLKIMEYVWRLEGLDFKLIPYGCLAVEANMGFIEVVTESMTISSIQKEQAGAVAGVFRDETLYNWMQKEAPHNNKSISNKSDTSSLRISFPTMVNNFTESCVGYCVGTYILGIGDRHNDNIMIKKTTGQLFHIDFGHFLGNFKSKFGIRRERVPFVLTPDFIYVICGGKKNRNSEEFVEFRKLCEKAFQIIREKGNLFMTLFAMMLSTGIPELQVAHDLDYLRNSLGLNRSDEEALLHFNASFKEACDKGWTTTFNWMVHNVKHFWVT